MYFKGCPFKFYHTQTLLLIVFYSYLVLYTSYSFSKHFLPTAVKRALSTLLLSPIYLVLLPVVKHSGLAGKELIFFTVSGMVLWICAGKCVDSRRIFSFLLSRARSASRPLCFPAHPIITEAGGAQRAGRGRSQDSCVQLSNGYSIPYGAVLKCRDGEGGRRGCSE